MEERAKASAGNDELVRKLQEEQARLAEESRRKQAELEAKLQAQVEETERMRRKKGEPLARGAAWV
jgi:hypothetical protein